MRSTTSPKVGQNNEWKLDEEDEQALNPRKEGGDFVPNFGPGQQKVASDGRPYPRNTVGAKSKYPLQTSRPGERRI